MLHCAHVKQQGFILTVVLLVLAVLSFMMLRGFELSVMQQQLIQLFAEKTALIAEADIKLKQLNLELDEMRLFNRQDSCLNRYYQLESSAQNDQLEAHIKAVFIKVPKHGLEGCDYKKGSRLVVEDLN